MKLNEKQKQLMIKMNKMNKKYLWLSGFTVWLVMCFAAPVISQAETYTYDVTGRLTGVTYDDGSSIIYTYDKAGNLLEKKVTATATSDPIPDIKANGSDSQITIGTSDTLSISVGVDANDSLGVECDLWVVVNTPTGEWEYYDLTQGTYIPGLMVTYQGALFNLGTTVVFNTSGLSAGTHTYYFSVDLNKNGTLDTGEGQFFFDSVKVTVTDTPLPKIYANGSEGSVTISTGEQLAITISHATDNYSGTDADWWIVVNTPSGWQYYNLAPGAYAPGLLVTYQGVLFNLGITEIFKTSSSGAGTYTYYFGVDLIKNGTLDMGAGQMYYATVVVTITP